MLTTKVKMRTLLHLGVLVHFLSIGCADFFVHCVKIHPDSSGHILVEVGKEFTAICSISKDSKCDAADIEWFFGNTKVPESFYHKLNNSAVSLTVNISSEKSNPLKCQTSKMINQDSSCVYGIYLEKGYPPLKPENLQCVAVQEGKRVSSKLNCSWDPGKRDPLIPTTYTLTVSTGYSSVNISSEKPLANGLILDLMTFPHHLNLNVYVEAKNGLQTVRSEELSSESEAFVKPNPPLNVSLIPEENFPTTLMVRWLSPIDKVALEVKYNIRFCESGSENWREVDQRYTESSTTSYRLQFLEPYTEYVVQMRNIDHKNLGYWSDWSPNVTARTPEDVPKSKPDLWSVYDVDTNGSTVVTLIWNDPKKSNGKIKAYNITVKEGNRQETMIVHSKKQRIYIKNKVFIKMTANNSVGVSPPATLLIHKPGHVLHGGIEKVEWSVSDGQILVRWPKEPNVSEYVVQWISVPENEINWQRVPSRNLTAQLDGLKPFTCYNISVYPIFQGKHAGVIYNQPGKPGHVEAYLKEGPPLVGPAVEEPETRKDRVHLKWTEISIEQRQGFLTNYTIFYKTGNVEKSVIVQPDQRSYNLTGLDSSTMYEVHIMASTKEGSVNGSILIFSTNKFDAGEIELYVVAVCLSFLFLIVFIMLFILKKKEMIKKIFWPQVPDPHFSTVASWLPDDCPAKADCPRESTLVDVSVMEVDMFDGKPSDEDSKGQLPLKKDKYLSEENSSGIGGSSCMSSPRQSVSSSDEADSGQTTASTVQYSSVVASAYKGQTPGSQQSAFRRSDSTQPLLDCEENHEPGSPPHTNSYFRRPRTLEPLHPGEGDSLTFSPMEEEDTPTLTEDAPDSTPSYMPQRNGYRPQ